jgi:outer membrane lipoprotein-sorting protein
LISYNTVYALTIDNSRVEFTRKSKYKSIEETIEGLLYYQFPGKVIVSIRKPIIQWMFFESNEITVYYPEDSIAFKINSPYPESFSFLETFLNVTKEDFGLCSRGYSLVSHEITKDTLITYWKPPKGLSVKLGELKLVFVDNRIISSELKKITGEPLLITSYSEHFNYKEYYFPLEISSKFFADKDTVFEKISYKNPTFNDSFPEEVVNFKIPEGIKIEEIKW